MVMARHDARRALDAGAPVMPAAVTAAPVQLEFAESPESIRPIARHTDPLTSHEAASEVPLTAQMEETLAALRAWRGVPPTSHELAGTNLILRYQYGRRLADLREAGHAVNGPSRRCAITG
jgi:hypothetical protein